MEIVDFLKKEYGFDYFKEPIPELSKKKLKMFPGNYYENLEKY